MTRHFPTAALALFGAFVLSLVGAVSDLPRSPPHEAQLFFADHLVHDWWNRFDARWYAGVDVTVVPQVHAQLVALLAKTPGLGLERSYALLLLLVGGALGLGVVRVARPTGWLVVMAVASPLAWFALVPMGAPGAVLGLALALNAAASARDARSTLEHIASFVLAAGAVATDLTGGLAVLVLAPCWLSTWRAAVSVLLGVGLGLVASGNALTSGFEVLRGPPLAHGWAGSLVVCVLAVIWLFAHRRLREGASAIAGTLLCGMSAWLELPQSSVLLVCSTVSLAVAASVEPGRRVIGFGLAALAFTSTSVALGLARNEDTRSRRAALRQVEWVLANVSDGASYRFVTLGLGPEWLELSRRVRPGSLDGGLRCVFEKDIEACRQRGLSWDSLDLTNTAEADRFVEQLGGATSVRWVVSGVAGAQALLEPLGFVSVGAWRGNVTLWERKNTPAMTDQLTRVKVPWRVGVLSPLLGVAALVVLLLGWRALSAHDVHA